MHLRLNSQPARAFLLVLGFLLALSLSLRPALGHLEDFSGARDSDFALAIYYPERAFLDGANPYDAASYLAHYPVRDAFAPYLPITLLLHLPFGLMPLATSAAVYLGLGILLTLVLASLCLRFNRVTSGTLIVLPLASMMVLSRPWRQCMLLGQVTLEAVLASYLALYFANSSPRVSGLGLALTSFKPSYGVPLALLMVVRRDWRALKYGVLFGFLLNLPAAAILAYRAGGIHMLSAQLANTSAGFQAMQPTNSPVLSPFRIDTVALIGRFVGHAPDIAAQLLVAITILGLAAVAIRAAPRSAAGPQSFGWSSGVVLAAVLLSVYHQPHDLLLLTVGFVALAAQSFYPGVPNRRMRMTMLVLCTFLAFNYTISDFVLQRLRVLAPGGTGELPGLVRSPYAVAFASLNGLALLALFCAYLVATVNQPRLVQQATIVAA